MPIQLFSALGVKGVSIQDIDTAHRVPSMKPSNRPNAIVCKFVRRLAKDQVMAASKKVGGLKAEEHGFAADVSRKLRSPILMRIQAFQTYPVTFLNTFQHL